MRHITINFNAYLNEACSGLPSPTSYSANVVVVFTRYEAYLPIITNKYFWKAVFQRGLAVGIIHLQVQF